MEREYGIGAVKMHLYKMIPSGAGLGGGSADAAFVLKGLDRLFGLNTGVEKLEELAVRLGSDTPFFIRNTTAMATGRGEILTPAPNPFEDKYIVIVVPRIHISTREAYSAVTPRIPAKPLAENAFEAALFPKYPALARIKKDLLERGAIYASLSGSGSAVYGIFDSLPRPEPWMTYSGVL
jgi:4-diphosphocytidyl-2-C-methyl-D-erythritol kinase